jgi:hypothetical protein
MGSGSNRAYWQSFGSRSGRRSGSKAGGRKAAKGLVFMKMKAARAEAKRRTNERIGQ